MRNEPATVPLRELRAAVPTRCFAPSTARSLAHLAFDVALLATLYALAWRAPAWTAPLYWLAQGTMLWALFVLGHDCGHGAFSRRRWLNGLVGHLTHTPLLVPYHAWRISHRIHHRHVGDVERDETWVPLTATQIASLPWYVRLLRFRLPLVAFPFYLVRRSPGRVGSHFAPRGALFRDGERARVALSVAACAAFGALLVAFAVVAGPGALVRWYVGPWLVFVVWIDLVTLLHHTAPGVPWYRGAAWSFARGALSTLDRRYGALEWLHHDAGCHVVHHLFPTIPHYRLREAARAVRPLLGESYREDRRALLVALREAIRDCHAVPESGDVALYEPRREAKVGARSLASGAGSRPATTW